MARPDVIIELSDKLLGQFFHNAAGTLVECPKRPSLFTDLSIIEVVALRGDDPAFDKSTRSLAAVQAFLQRNVDPQATVPRDEMVTIMRGNASIRVPSL